jgi:hypothetical protein
MVLGLDWGSVLGFFVVFGWLTIATLPLGAIALVGLTMFLVVKKFRNRAAPS